MNAKNADLPLKGIFVGNGLGDGNRVMSMMDFLVGRNL